MDVRLGAGLTLVAIAGSMTACGSAAATSSEAGTRPQLSAPSLTVEPVGDPTIQIVPGGSGEPAVTLTEDDAGLLVVHVTLRNTNPVREDVLLKASLYDVNAVEVGTATGGTVFLAGGETRTVTLAGNRPTGGSAVRVRVRVDLHPTVGEPTPTP